MLVRSARGFILLTVLMWLLMLSSLVLSSVEIAKNDLQIMKLNNEHTSNVYKHPASR